MKSSERKNWYITTIALILISTAGAAFNNVIEVFVENIIKKIIPVTNEITLHFIVFLIFLVVLTLLGFGFKKTFRRITRR